ncbi:MULTISPECIES: hypothetical protein [unclassified Neorhizobium]|uniref:hypothetical protein n=1 Tax=unclassified Neorhizobium TaxID=2629175 RepID=UPI001FF35818|nr:MULTISPECIES: hypothetical protein [unclassified Neorhizobium]MCJ9669444.1 hypothetical protein [Neorhizobium sp. SHOUNA12B]MCJ9745531.1 hypothetical protein [Neorhizobium sp. SHOUNA12A]
MLNSTTMTTTHTVRSILSALPGDLCAVSQSKSKKGIATPGHEIELIAARLKRAEALCKEIMRKRPEMTVTKGSRNFFPIF